MATRFVAQVLFWISVALTAYVYFGYPVLLGILGPLKNKRSIPTQSPFEPHVSLIITAYNEERAIAQKLKNSLALDYPTNKLEIIVVSDGSTDKTAQIAREYTDQDIQLIELPQNVGKASAQNEAVKQANGDILLFTDSEVLLLPNVVAKLVNHLQDTNVGCVVGHVTYLNEMETGVSEGEGFYWRYELFIRERESQLGNLAMGSGSILAVRRELFRPLDPAVSEDFVLPMGAAIWGYRTMYEPEAIARVQLCQVGAKEMFTTKVRTITLDTRSILLCRAILNPFRYPLYAWGLVSHKLLRWLVPYFLIVLASTNLFLLGFPLYKVTMALQIAFYILAGIGTLWHQKNKPPRIFSIPFSFCLVNAAALMGVIRFIRGKKSGKWEPIR